MGHPPKLRVGTHGWLDQASRQPYGGEPPKVMRSPYYFSLDTYLGGFPMGFLLSVGITGGFKDLSLWGYGSYIEEV